ncbi:MAG: PRC-barrel domain-containing protein, partial [Cyanobium sp.]
VALGLRDNPLTRFLPGLPRWMPLERIRQVGDVILVDSADSLSESFDPERFSKVINCQVITESGMPLGRVLGFSFDVETGELTTLVIGALGVPLLGEGVLSTWEMPVGEIVSSGTDRIIVYEGAEEKLKQLGTGLLEKLGIGGSSWEQEERQRFRSAAVPAENQLPAGQPSASEQRRIEPAVSRAFRPEQDYDYVELEERREREPLRQRRYLDEEEPQPQRRRYDEERFDDQAYSRREDEDRGFPDRSRDPDDRDGEPARRSLDQRQPRAAESRAYDDGDEDEPVDRPHLRDVQRGSTRPESQVTWGTRDPGASRFAPREDDEDLQRSSPSPSKPSRRQPVEVEAEVLDDPW